MHHMKFMVVAFGLILFALFTIKWRMFNPSQQDTEVVDDVRHNYADEEEIRDMIGDQDGGQDAKMLGPYMPLTEETQRQVQKVQRQRKRRVRKVCEKHDASGNVRELMESRELLVDQRHRILFCYVPKVGCTSWKVRLVLGSGLTDDVEGLSRHPSVVDRSRGLAKFGIKSLKSFSSKQIKHILDNYYKFMFVRHPLERILSSYRSKWERRQDNTAEYPRFYRKYYKRIAKVLGQEHSNGTLSFEEFVRFVTKDVSPKDHHWDHYYKLCHVCEIKYNFIGKFDTLQDDVAFVLRQIYRSTTEFYFPNVTKPRSALERMEQYYGQLDHQLIEKLEGTYSMDFELFGYDFNNIS